MSDPVECDLDLADNLIDMEDEQVSAVLVHIRNREDALLFAENAHMSRLPVCFLADGPEGWTLLCGSTKAGHWWTRTARWTPTRCVPSPPSTAPLCFKYHWFTRKVGGF